MKLLREENGKSMSIPGKPAARCPICCVKTQSQTPQAEQVETQNREDQLALAGLTEIIFSDIFEVQLADHTKVRGCFALWKQTRHILAIAFENHMRADLVVSTIDLIEHVIPGTIFHSDQGSQYGAEQTRAALLQKGFIRSMSRAGTPTDNGFAERFVGQFKLSVAERRSYHTLGMFLQAAEDWINFYNHLRPHESLDDLSPDQCAQLNGLPVAEPIRLMTAPNRVAAVSDAAMAATSVPHKHVQSRHATLLP